MYYQHPIQTLREDRTVLYAHNLPTSINYLNIEQAFRQCNILVTVSLDQDSLASDKACLVAQIRFMSVADAEKAFATVQLSYIPGEVPEVRMMLSRTRLLSQPAPYAGRIVRHLPKGITASQLYDVIRPFGPVEYVEVSEEAGGILHFQDETQAQKVESGLARLAFLWYEPSTLICTNLDPDITKETLRANFEQLDIGPIVNVDVTMNSSGSVTYQTPLMAFVASERVNISALGPNAKVSFRNNGTTVPTRRPYALHDYTTACEHDDFKKTRDAIIELARREAQAGVNDLKAKLYDQEMELQDLRKERNELKASFDSQIQSMEIESLLFRANLRDQAGKHTDELTRLERVIEDLRTEINLHTQKVQLLQVDRHVTETAHVRDSEARGEQEASQQENAQLKEQIRCLQDDKHEANVKEAAQTSLIEALRQEVRSLNEQLTTTKEDQRIQLEHKTERIETLEQERDGLEIARIAAEKQVRHRQAEIDELHSENNSLKEQYTAMETQYTLLSNSFNVQCSILMGEKETLRDQRDRAQSDCGVWRHKFDVAESRCKILELDRCLLKKLEDAKRQKEKEKEESERVEQTRRKKEVEESKRKMREMLEQEREVERVKRMEKEREAARKAGEAEARKKRQAELVKEKSRQAAWRAATNAEFERCRKRDMDLVRDRPWNKDIALERFKHLVTEFEKSKFSEGQPLTLGNIPWPTLHPVFYDPLSFTFRTEKITWKSVEKFFFHVKKAYPFQEYSALVEKVHRLFHPDKWRSRRVLDSVQDPDLRQFLESTGNIVAQAMTPIWKESKGGK